MVSKKFYNKCSENSRSQIVFRTDIFRKLTLGAPADLISIVNNPAFETTVSRISRYNRHFSDPFQTKNVICCKKSHRIVKLLLLCSRQIQCNMCKRKKKGLCATLNRTLVPCEQRFLSCMAFSVYKVITGRKQTNYARDKPRE